MNYDVALSLRPTALDKPLLRGWQMAFTFLRPGWCGTHTLRCEAAVGLTQLLGSLCGYPHDR
jgi:hypothetical protein